MLDQRDSSLTVASDVGAALARLRVAKGLGIGHLSECLGIPERVIKAIEDGAIDGHLEQIYGLLCIYAESTHEVFKGFFKQPSFDGGGNSDDLTAYVTDCIAFHKEMHGKAHYLSTVPRARGKSLGHSINFVAETSRLKSKKKNTPLSVLEFRAQEVISKHSLYRLPINVYQVAENLRAHVIFESLPNEFYMKLKAFCYKEDGFSLIGINKSHPVVLQRYSLAHELHHLLYDNVQRFTCGPRNESKEVEIDAERFAAELLMPRNMMERLVSNPLNISYLTINLVAQHFGVSYEAAAIRLEKFGLIGSSKDACNRLYRRKDKQKTDFLLSKKEKYLKAVFGLETGIAKLQEYCETIAHHALCGAPITDNAHTVCWRCGLELNPLSTQFSFVKNPYRQNPSNLLPSKIKSIQDVKEKGSNQLSLNLRIN